jgi:ribosomal protein S18 acetylase RimI-like enzyme
LKRKHEYYLASLPDKNSHLSGIHALVRHRKLIRYATSPAGITADMLGGFFVGWPNPPSPETHFSILKNSSHVVVAVDEEASRVVGFINAVSDGIMSAYIPLLEVLPEYQGRGIGTELVRRMLSGCSNLYMVDTTCDPSLQPFYVHGGHSSRVSGID